MRVSRIAAISVALAAVGMLAAALPATAQAPAPRITSQGGMNLVPTPKGLGFPFKKSDEKLLGYCNIGAGCSSREFAIDGDGSHFLGNVGFAPTSYVAHRFLLYRADYYRHSKLFVGSVKVTTKNKVQYLKLSGTWYGIPFRRVMARQGRKLVLAEIIVRSDFKQASMSALTSKAKTPLKQSWAKVVTTVLPAA